jgi:polyphenol oxidase
MAIDIDFHATHCCAQAKQAQRILEPLMAAPVSICCEHLSRLDERIHHGFFTRQGGFSDGVYRSLNAGLGSGDDRATVLRNRAAIASNLDGAFLATPLQTHSDIVIHVDRPWADGERPIADAVVTDEPGLAIGVLTADCGPVLFADTETGIIGAAHAGWKGATGDILANTVLAMERLGAGRKNIIATLGPTIAQANYETGPEFITRLIDQSPGNEAYFVDSSRPGHACFDLPSYIVDRLRMLGVSAGWTGHCTYAEEDRFFSYRRATHRQEFDYGRQMSAIVIRE